ncbi:MULTISPECIES: DNA repair protein RecN [Arthrobacter]|uniref:DNA repair protein RecN n=2 Tax=Arthrobacter TaxID=1663 RepID=A0ABU9KNJ4_9MICC|nr:DNA repair protein RecN [Arthrobacter sp. YJM1]MDP5228505.1 DNA repair protein RecN [Arthrobacter sp. YJM1]
MIEELRIRDLGVISEARLPLGPGLSVVTGETGAGKTMVVTAVGLLLGARADAGAVRVGARAASVEATALLPHGHSALERAEEAGAETEDSDAGTELLLARSVSMEGRSRAYLGGRSAPVGALAEVGERLLVIHGQTDQIRLKSSAAQREALDKFGGTAVGDALAAYQDCYRACRAAEQELEALTTAERERLREAESLQSALEEIDAVAPEEGEDERLKAESVKLAHVEQLRIAAGTAQAVLSGDDYAESGDALQLLATAQRALEQVSQHDGALEALAIRVGEASVLLEDISSELAHYASGLETEGPEHLAALEARRAELAKLVRKYAPSVDEVLSWAEESRTRLEELEGDSERIETLQSEVQARREELLTLGAGLHGLRSDAAVELASRVSAELAALAMPDARLHVKVEETEPGPHGADQIAILLQPHAGAPARPVGKGASGGELSRVMLAIEVVLAEVDPVPTFVFDEVDAGVGGRAAVEIGRRLAMLARHVQVLVVTHLPQVAAFADRHVRVIKNSVRGADGGLDSGFTSSDVEVLDGEARVVELARMLAGQEDSESARAHAQELLDDARQFAASSRA